MREIARGVRVGASWGIGDVVIFGSGANFRRVDASGGAVSDVTTIEGPDWEHL